jgi:hypothetical protein
MLCELDGRGPILSTDKTFSQTGSVIHLASYPVALCLWVKRPGVRLTTNAEVKNDRAIPPPPTRLHGVKINYFSKGANLPFIYSYVL